MSEINKIDFKQLERDLTDQGKQVSSPGFLLGRPSPRILGRQYLHIKSFTTWLNVIAVLMILFSAIKLSITDHHSWFLSSQDGEVKPLAAVERVAE